MPLTDDFSYKLKDDGIILNPDALVPPFVDITTVRGFDSAPFRVTERDHEGTDGGFMDAELEKGRPIFLEGELFADDGTAVEPFLDTLKANWAPSRVLLPLYAKKPGVDERVLFVKPLGVRYDVDQLRRVGRVAVQFQAFAEDPRIYTSTLQGSTMDLGAIQGDGFEFPIGFPFGFGTLPSTDDGNYFHNLGNRPTPVKFTISGPVTTPLIVNDTAGRTLKFNITLGSGDTLDVDTAARTVLLNGSANRRSTLEEPNWFFLQPGANFIRYRAAQMTASTLNVQFRHAWR